MERLLTYRKPVKEQLAATMSIAESSQAHQSTSYHIRSIDMDRHPHVAASPYVPPISRDHGSHAYPPTHVFSSLLRSLKAEGLHMKSDTEKELRSIHYGKKPTEVEEGKCNGCRCGKSMPGPLQDPKSQAEGPPVKPCTRCYRSCLCRRKLAARLTRQLNTTHSVRNASSGNFKRFWKHKTLWKELSRSLHGTKRSARA